MKSAEEAGRFRLKLEVIGMINEDGLETRVSGKKWDFTQREPPFMMSSQGTGVS